MPTLTTVAVARTGEDTFHWERAVLDDPGPGEVLVRLVAAGLCHTDLSVLAGRLPTPLPAVLGHEGAGTVEAVGADVTRVAPGDHVVLSFNSCGHCDACRTGRPTACATYFPLNFRAARADGTTPIHTEDGAPLGGMFFGQSSLARHAVVSAQSIVRVEVTDEEELAQLAPVGCCVQTGAGAILNLLQPRYGESVVVFGAGAVGLSAVMAARLTPARAIVAVDLVPSRLALASTLGATHTIDSSRVDLSSRIADVTGPGGATYIVETTGIPSLLERAAETVAADGTVAVIGAPAAGSRASFDVNALIDGRTVRGVTEGGSDRVTFIPALIDLARQGRLPYEKFVRYYAEDRLHQAVADARSGHTIKPVICFDNRTGQGR